MNLSVYLTEQKTFLFDNIIDYRDKPTRPLPTITLRDGLILSQIRRYKLEILTQFDTGFKALQIFEQKNLYSSEIIAFL